eukprot:c18015_g1_i1.p1 GENE.c18015_g1_i1~~c18015_g1_i1.p1  ORF type:complete len:418 (+),score=106.43 c18015_g1_i1:3-1256(+)
MGAWALFPAVPNPADPYTPVSRSSNNFTACDDQEKQIIQNLRKAHVTIKNTYLRHLDELASAVLCDLVVQVVALRPVGVSVPLVGESAVCPGWFETLSGATMRDHGSRDWEVVVWDGSRVPHQLHSPVPLSRLAPSPIGSLLPVILPLRLVTASSQNIPLHTGAWVQLRNVQIREHAGDNRRWVADMSSMGHSSITAMSASSPLVKDIITKHTEVIASSFSSLSPNLVTRCMIPQKPPLSYIRDILETDALAGVYRAVCRIHQVTTPIDKCVVSPPASSATSSGVGELAFKIDMIIKDWSGELLVTASDLGTPELCPPFPPPPAFFPLPALTPSRIHTALLNSQQQQATASSSQGNNNSQQAFVPEPEELILLKKYMTKLAMGEWGEVLIVSFVPASLPLKPASRRFKLVFTQMKEF